MEVRPLTEATWPAFERLVEAHGGVWGGCWCLAFHAGTKGGTLDERRARKQALVVEGRSHAALVMEGERCRGWAQYGRRAELPEVRNRKAYQAGLEEPPDWRITCFFVDKEARQAGVAARALEGALELIAAEGGGVVEGYGEAIEGQKTSAGFLWSGTVGMFERAGFEVERQIGKHRWVMRRQVTAA